MESVIVAVATAVIGAGPVTATSTLATPLDEDIRAREAEIFGTPTDEPAPPGDDVRAREAEMFGSPAAPEEAEDRPPPASASARTSTSARSRRRKIVLPSDARTPVREGVLDRLTDRVDALDDTLAIGGTMWLQIQATAFDEGPIGESALSSPNLVDVFLDGRPNDRLRGFLQGRLTYDPTAGDAGGGSVLDLGGGGQAETQVQLDQLWLRFDVARTVFVTAGKQRIRWGSGRLWNPTDFLNQQRLNPIALFDIRLGVPLIKAHVPVESLGWNFYAVANLEGASALERVGGAVRAELLLGDTELSLSAALRQGSAQRFGIDFTAPIWDFDVRVELALVHDDPNPRLPAFDERVLTDDTLEVLSNPNVNVTAEDVIVAYVPEPINRRRDWIPQVVVGTEIAIRYSDRDTLILGLEYFFNDAGYADEDVYPRLLLAGRFNPLDVGRHYLGFFGSLIGPGDWDDTSLVVSAIANLSDLSGVVRGDLSFQLLTFLSFRVFANAFWGTGAFSPQIGFNPLLLDVFAFDPTALGVFAERIPVPGASIAGPVDDGLAGVVDTFALRLPVVQVGAALVIGL